MGIKNTDLLENAINLKYEIRLWRCVIFGFLGLGMVFGILSFWSIGFIAATIIIIPTQSYFLKRNLGQETAVDRQIQEIKEMYKNNTL